MEVTESALKLGIGHADIDHAWTNAIRLVEFADDGQSRLLVIGPDRHGRMLELVAVRAGHSTGVIHVGWLRPKFFSYLR